MALFDVTRLERPPPHYGALPCVNLELITHTAMRRTTNSGAWDDLTTHLRRALDWDLLVAYRPRYPTGRTSVIVIENVPEDRQDATISQAVEEFLNDRAYFTQL